MVPDFNTQIPDFNTCKSDYNTTKNRCEKSHEMSKVSLKKMVRGALDLLKIRLPHRKPDSVPEPFNGRVPPGASDVYRGVHIAPYTQEDGSTTVKLMINRPLYAWEVEIGLDACAQIGGWDYAILRQFKGQEEVGEVDRAALFDWPEHRVRVGINKLASILVAEPKVIMTADGAFLVEWKFLPAPEKKDELTQ